MLDAGYAAGCRLRAAGVRGSGCWFLVAGYWIRGARCELRGASSKFRLGARHTVYASSKLKDERSSAHGQTDKMHPYLRKKIRLSDISNNE